MTFIIQFDDASAIVALSLLTRRVESSTEEQWIPLVLLYRVSLALPFSPTIQHPPVSPCTAEWALALRASRSITPKAQSQIRPL